MDCFWWTKRRNSRAAATIKTVNIEIHLYFGQQKTKIVQSSNYQLFLSFLYKHYQLTILSEKKRKQSIFNNRLIELEFESERISVCLFFEENKKTLLRRKNQLQETNEMNQTIEWKNAINIVCLLQYIFNWYGTHIQNCTIE